MDFTPKPSKLPETIPASFENSKNLAKSAHGYGKLPAVTPEEIDRVRRSVLYAVKTNLPRVRAVLSGDLRWTNQQVKLFQIMLNKVMPDLSASMNQHIHEQKGLHELTRAELEAIASRSSKAEKEERKREQSHLLDDDSEPIDITAEEAVSSFSGDDCGSSPQSQNEDDDDENEDPLY